MDRFKATKRAGILGIFCNIILLFIKSIIGYTARSQAMIADSINSASDIFASLMTFVGNKIASEPKDDNHNFGHGKAEYIFSLFISISMVIVSLKLCYDSILSLINGSELEFSYFLVVVCIITIIIKFALYIYTKNLYEKHNNILLKANCEDHRNDCIVTSFTLVSIIASLYGFGFLDGLVGTGISVWIFYTGATIFLESYNVLMDISVDEDTKNLILDLANSYKDILKIGHLYSSPIGEKYIIVLSIYVDGNLPTFESHNLADSLEKSIKALDNVSNAIVHVNPM